MVLRKAVIGSDYYKGLNDLTKGADLSGNNFFMKALTSDTTNSGAEFLPKAWSADIIRELYERAWHRQVIPTITMTTEKQAIPSFTSRFSATYVGSNITTLPQADQIPESTVTTADREIVLKTLVINLQVNNKYLTYNVAGASQIEMMIKEDIVKGVMESEIDAIINGDESATHQDHVDINGEDVNGTPYRVLSGDARKCFNGLRKLAGKSLDVLNAGFTEDTISKMFLQLGRYAQGSKDRCVLLISPQIADQIRRNVIPVQTLEVYGQGATIFKGEMPVIFGVQPIETNYLRADLNATGVYDGVTTDRTLAVMFNADEVFIGVSAYAERAMKFSKKEEDEFDRKRLIVVEDFGFQARHVDAIVKAYNVSTTA